jgi:hypothetical protein
MKRYLLPLSVAILLVVGRSAVSAAENAAVTENSIPLMAGPSFTAGEIGGVTIYNGQRLEAVSRTSFADRLAAVPEDYWYLISYRECGALRSGYVHGSSLALDTAVTVPIYDPPGFSPKPRVVSGRYTVASFINGGRCAHNEGVILVPEGTVATHFTIDRFDSSFTPCPAGGYASIIGFSIISATDPSDELFSYEEHLADDPAELQYTKDGFYYFDLEPGTYTLAVRGGQDTVLKLSYELRDER